MESAESAVEAEGPTGLRDVGASAPDKKKALIAVGIAVVVCLVVFGLVLPQIVDWNEVFDLLGQVDGADLAIIAVLAIIRYLPAGWTYSLVMPDLSVRHGTETWIATTAVSSTIPGFDLVLRVAMYASYGFPVDRATTGMFLSGIVEMSTKFVLAVVAVTFWALVEFDLGLLAVAAIAAVAAALLGVGLAMVLRSEKVARNVGAKIDRFVKWAMGKVDRQAPERLIDRIVGARSDAREVLGQSWLRAFTAAVLGQALVIAILTLSLRAVGVDSDAVGLADILLAHALVIILTSIPITPGSVGVAELVYVGVLTVLAGQEWSAFITAGVILFRLAVWLLPIPIGWVVVLRWESRVGVNLFSTPTSGNAGR